MPPPGYHDQTDLSQMNFAEKLAHLLARTELESIVEWRPHGRAFKVYVPQLFALHVCPQYFGHNSYARFRRDLVEHGFKHIPSGLDENGTLLLFVTHNALKYLHELLTNTFVLRLMLLQDTTMSSS